MNNYLVIVTIDIIRAKSIINFVIPTADYTWDTDLSIVFSQQLTVLPNCLILNGIIVVIVIVVDYLLLQEQVTQQSLQFIELHMLQESQDIFILKHDISIMNSASEWHEVCLLSCFYTICTITHNVLSVTWIILNVINHLSFL